MSYSMKSVWLIGLLTHHSKKIYLTKLSILKSIFNKYILIG